MLQNIHFAGEKKVAKSTQRMMYALFSHVCVDPDMSFINFTYIIGLTDFNNIKGIQSVFFLSYFFNPDLDPDQNMDSRRKKFRV